MAKNLKPHKFRDKLILNQWLIYQFGINPLEEFKQDGKSYRPFHKLSHPIKDLGLEGLSNEWRHTFCDVLLNSALFHDEYHSFSRDQLKAYEANIFRYTRRLNEHRERDRKVVWKYYQWLSLLFTEIYLDQYFQDPKSLLQSLNEWVDAFNQKYDRYEIFPHFTPDDLNKICFQNATGSGKTLLMHVHLMQYRHYARQAGLEDQLSRVILITPNERLTGQHISEFRKSGISAQHFLDNRGGLFGQSQGLSRVDVIEIQKLKEEEGPNTVAVRSLGNENLILVDEGHRGLSGKEAGAWLQSRADLCEKGFSFEYSATFEQALGNNKGLIDEYAKSVLFDYSYRWFYEDGFGKDYQILNLPDSFKELQQLYLTACTLKFYQQLRVYEEFGHELRDFHIEKPLWVFVGTTVTGGKTAAEKGTLTDIGLIINFLSDFLDKKTAYIGRIHSLLTQKGQDTGLMDEGGNDIFAGAFPYLKKLLTRGENAASIYQDLVGKAFNAPSGGKLQLARVKGNDEEIVLKVGASEAPFGLIYVGKVAELSKQLEAGITGLSVSETEFSQAMFAEIKESSSPINLLVGAKKFIEGWDCWRVSTMGLMHVGKSEGAQIIQLFGRGVRLKGYNWSLRRSGHAGVGRRIPPFMEELETLNVFGIEASFMEKFRDYLKDEGLPGNERRETIAIDLNVTYDFGKKLKTLRPKRKSSDGKEFSFKTDGPVPTFGEIPPKFKTRPLIADWYPRIQSLRSRGRDSELRKDSVKLKEEHMVFFDWNEMWFELERFKADKSWYNFNIARSQIKPLLLDGDWYDLKLPETRLSPEDFQGVRLLQSVATDLLKKYMEAFYNYKKAAFIEPRLEYRELSRTDDNFPQDDQYLLVVDGDEEVLIKSIQDMQKALKNGQPIPSVNDLKVLNFGNHLYEPLLHTRRGSKVKVMPVALNEGEYDFVKALMNWCESNAAALGQKGEEVYLLRNLSRGRGVGFFEAGNFYPDFILWKIKGEKQRIIFIDPKGLVHLGPEHPKLKFYETIKGIENRLGDPEVSLDSYILSVTVQEKLDWGLSKEELKERHVLFLGDLDLDEVLG